MNNFKTYAVLGLLLVSTAACSSAKTSTSAPDTTKTASPSAAPTMETAPANKNDAASDLRRKQLDSDIRAREQRNNITGGDAIRADGDLASEVRSKLEANLPKSALLVKAKDGAVVVSGAVPSSDQLAKIAPLAKQIKGVKSVKVDAKVSAGAN